MQYIFDISISRDELLKFYSGAARNVQARDRRGLRVVFPAAILRQFVGSDGVRGTFRLDASADGRLQSIERLV